MDQPIKYFTVFTVLFLLIEMNHSMKTKRISEAICQLNRFKYADILEGSESDVQLSRELFKVLPKHPTLPK